jgi:hypothetical protein
MDISSREDDMNMLAVSSVVNQRCEIGEREASPHFIITEMTKTETICTPGRINVNGSCGPSPLVPRLSSLGGVSPLETRDYELIIVRTTAATRHPRRQTEPSPSIIIIAGQGKKRIARIN